MKKVIVCFMTFTVVIFLVSCGHINKKTIPEDTTSKLPPVADNNAIIIVPPDSNTQDMEPANTISEQNKDTQVSKNENASTEGSLKQLPDGLSSEKIIYWNPGLNKEHKSPTIKATYKSILDKYNGYILGDTSSKVIYLTFDEGYENGYTGQILDILKDNNVKAAFFVTKPYIKINANLIKRMVQEGHIVGNHSSTHPSMPDLSADKMEKEIVDTAEYFKEITGSTMPKFFRPPMGEWSEQSLYTTNSLGYKTILWSMAHLDWDPQKQPGKEASYNYVDTYYHNGAILLLHAVSKSNTEALGDIIKNLKNNGYSFASLYEIKH